MLNNIASMLGAGGGVATDYESIATTTVGAGGSASITFSSIPSTYTHLQIRGITRLATGGGTSDSFFYAQFNGDTASNYGWHYLLGDGSTASAGASSTQTQIVFGSAPQSGVTASVFNASVTDILDYANSNKNKTVRILSGNDRNGSGSALFTSGLWRSTSAITSVTITSASNFAQYSSFALYGIK